MNHDIDRHLPVRAALTLGEWSDAIPLLHVGLVELLTGATPVAQERAASSSAEAAAVADVIAAAEHWQEYFAVDGDAAANELCPVDVPSAFPAHLRVWTRPDE